MAKKIGNLAGFVLFLCIFVLFTQSGCENRRTNTSRREGSRQFEKEGDKVEEEFYAELARRMEQTEKMMEPYRKNGLVKVSLQPSDGEVYIDGGVASIPERGLMLPIGTYTVKGLWPDGSEASKKVFVTPALQQAISWKWNVSRNSSGVCPPSR